MNPKRLFENMTFKKPRYFNIDLNCDDVDNNAKKNEIEEFF